LINEYQPILNNASGVPMISFLRSLNYQGASAFHPPAPRKPAQKLLPAPQESPPALTPVTRHVVPVRSSRYRWAGSFALAALIATVYLGWRAWPFGIIGSQPPKRVAATDHSTPSPANSSIVPPQQQSAVSVIPEAEASAKVSTEQSKIADKIETASSSTGATTAPKAAKEPIPQPANEATASSEVKNPSPRAAPNSERPNKWTVQVRATLDRADATGAVKRLKARGYDAFVAEAEIKGKIWYRVRVGNFATQPQAETLQKQLRGEEGFRDAFIVNKASESLVLAKRSGESVTYEP
jgi:cell division septation protein DedD